MTFLVFLGAPGSGKGTQAQNLVLTYPDMFAHISTGDLLRQEVKKKSEAALRLQMDISAGNFISDDIIFDLMEEKIKTIDDSKKIILDGFPRTFDQAQRLLDFVKKTGKRLEKVVYFGIADELLFDRLSGRMTCNECGAVYHQTAMPERCSCGSTSFRVRADDNENVIRNRLEIFHAETEPLVSYYEAQRVLFRVDAAQSIDGIKQELLKVLGL
ncbi:MAG: nucleoside monophosphate kinase [Pseudomonadota bacterium]|nr:nucleoside monophosphate kinase [Alphaproteobacteria bacterium]MDP5012786.1 nucleoside monophosphate kinase [Alphaproteobacteria bacterium]MDP5370034.1 nucleoside monophosphate kinase [Pseudomonadota bacterium]